MCFVLLFLVILVQDNQDIPFNYLEMQSQLHYKII